MSFPPLLPTTSHGDLVICGHICCRCWGILLEIFLDPGLGSKGWEASSWHGSNGSEGEGLGAGPGLGRWPRLVGGLASRETRKDQDRLSGAGKGGRDQTQTHIHHAYQIPLTTWPRQATEPLLARAISLVRRGADLLSSQAEVALAGSSLIYRLYHELGGVSTGSKRRRGGIISILASKNPPLFLQSCQGSSIFLAWNRNSDSRPTQNSGVQPWCSLIRQYLIMLLCYPEAKFRGSMVFLYTKTLLGVLINIMP